ncbi:MAG: hypothetical protein ABJA11_10140 [Pseudolysinimonas sp.]
MAAPDFSALPAPVSDSSTRHTFDLQRIGVGPVYAVVFIGIAGGFGAGFMNLAGNTFAQVGKSASGPIWTIGWIASIVAILVGVVPIVVLVARVIVARRRPTNPGRLVEFARANSLSYQPQSAVPPFPGAIFSAGMSREAFDRLTSTQGRTVEIGNVAYSIPAGRSTTTRTWGYIAIPLDRPLPHILLESAAYGQNTAGALPVAVDRTQRVSLEGDFDRFFTLYCPDGFQTDALYLLTPDLMALLVDQVADFDVEIVDSWLFVYSPTDFSSAGEAEYRRLFSIIDMLEAKAVAQASHYHHDDAEVASARSIQVPAVAPGAVVAPGSRLTPAASQYSRLTRISLVFLTVLILVFIAGSFIVAGYANAR